MEIIKGKKLYNKAKKIIPGGNQLLSKRPEMFLPGGWPNYFAKANGINVWDLDDNKYSDFSIMGIGTCSLGYANKKVNKDIKKAINHGTMTSLNCFEEVKLAEKLISLHPFAEMVRYTRTGGEGLSVAVRIARAASGKSKVAVAGYHGWHDWYLAVNLSDSKNLDNLLLPGLEPVGVPEELKNTSFPFHYGKINELEKIIAENKGEIGVIVVEVQRNRNADVEFLKKVKQLARENNIVLIFDEVSSGFRLSVGGIHQIYGVEPDICVLGKTLGNGFPISAILGRKSVMESAQDSFISSSFWTERIGFVAALSTIEEFERNNVIDHLKEMGNYFENQYNKIFKDLDLKIEVVGLLTVPTLSIKEDNPLLIKTVFTQEMLKRGCLASNITYLSFAHNKKNSSKYFSDAYEVFKNIKVAIKNNNLKDLLEGEECHSGFRRLT